MNSPHVYGDGRNARKVSRACDTCKAKKARCSGTKPCDQCSRRALRCSYDSQYLRGRPPTPPPSSRSPPQDSGAFQSTATPSRPPVELQVEPEPTATEEDAPGTSRNSPEAEGTDVHGQYVDPTSAFAFLHRARKRFAPQYGNEVVDAGVDAQELQPVFAAGDKPLLGAYTSAIVPVEADAVSLLDLYFDVCVATYSIVHRQTVDSWNAALQQNVRENREPTEGIEKPKAAILFSLFAIATFNRQKSRGHSEDEGSLLQSDCLFRKAVELTSAETGVARLESVQARILQVFYLLMTCRMTRAWYTFGICLQMISALGMHRRTSKRRGPGKGADYIHSQCRKRTFWTIYILDRILGVVFGRPPHFNDDDIDQDLPDRVNNEDMDLDGPKPGTGDSDCHLDAFVFNARLGRILGDISRTLYSLRPLSVDEHQLHVQRFEEQLAEWSKELPPFLSTVKPSSLIRSFRRQSVALRLAHCHLVMHLYRPYLLGNNTSTLRRTAPNELRRGVGRCLISSQEVLKIVDEMAQDGPLFHAFWWTHYVTFVALAAVYVFKIQRMRNVFQSNTLANFDSGNFFDLAERCHTHLAVATASNSPSRKYSIVLEELRTELQARSDRAARARPVEPDFQSAHASPDHSSIQQVRDIQHPAAGDIQSGDVLSLTPNTDVASWLNEWQSTDWLDLDASAFGPLSEFSPPDMNWLSTVT